MFRRLDDSLIFGIDVETVSPLRLSAEFVIQRHQSSKRAQTLQTLESVSHQRILNSFIEGVSVDQIISEHYKIT